MHIFHLNVSSLKRRLDEIHNFICDSTVDIIGFTESSLNRSISDQEVSISGFSLYRCDRYQQLRGGVAVYVRENLNVTRRIDLECNEIESVWLELHQNKTKSFLIGYIYRPPSSLVSWYDIFEKNLECASKINAHLMILGDFNINLFKDACNKNASTLSELCTSYGLTQIIERPTRVTNTSSSTLLDHIYVSSTTHVNDVKVSEYNISDHYRIGVSWKINSSNIKTSHNIIQYRKKLDYKEVQELAAYKFNVDGNAYELGEKVNNFNDVLISSIHSITPLVSKRVKQEYQPPWFSSEIFDAIQKKEKAKRKNYMMNIRCGGIKCCL